MRLTGQLMMGFLLLLLTLALSYAQPALERLYTPEDLVAWAEQDAARFGPERRKYLQYFTLAHYESNKRIEKARVIAGDFLHHVSTAKSHTPPHTCMVPGTDNCLLRVFLDHYEMQRHALEFLGERGSGFPEADRDRATPEPYFSKLVATESKGRIKFSNLPYEFTRNLRELTYCKHPIMRGDWFLYYGSLAPAYYELLGLGNEDAKGAVVTLDQLFKFAFTDEKQAEKGRIKTNAIVFVSAVSENNRVIETWPSEALPRGGAFWLTTDTFHETNDRKYVNNPLRFKGDANEAIWSLRNGLLGFWINNAQRKRVDFADARIVRDNESGFRDPSIWAMRNCRSCHQTGFRDITDAVRARARTLLPRRIPGLDEKLNLNVVDPKDAVETQDKYLATDINELLEMDRLIYKNAIAKATYWEVVGPGGVPLPLPTWTPEVSSGAFLTAARDYKYKLVTMEMLAREVGWPPADLRAVLQATKGKDWSLTDLAENDIPVKRAHVEEDMDQLRKVLKAVKP